MDMAVLTVTYTKHADAYSRWLFRHTRHQNRSTLEGQARSSRCSHCCHDGQRYPRRQRKVHTGRNECESSGILPYIGELTTDSLQDYLAKPVKGKLLEKVKLLEPHNGP